VAAIYPDFPNDTIKRKYYDLIANFPVFMPNLSMANRFSRMLDEFPVSPYLRNRESLTRWVYFMHNKYNAILGKHSPLSFEKAQEEFLAQFDRQEIRTGAVDKESYPQTWIRRHRTGAILLCLVVVAGALGYAGRGFAPPMT
jgi:hypothetical protein